MAGSVEGFDCGVVRAGIVAVAGEIKAIEDEHSGERDPNDTSWVHGADLPEAVRARLDRLRGVSLALSDQASNAGHGRCAEAASRELKTNLGCAAQTGAS